MQRAEGSPPEQHCRNCGAKLEVLKAERRRVGGPFSPHQWQADLVCPRCGAKSGVGWAVMTSEHPPENPIARFLSKLRRLPGRRKPAKARRESLRFRDEAGRLDLSKLVTEVAFPVYGLKGRPLGLSLRSPGFGASGTREVVNQTAFGYTAGPRWEPDYAIEIEQGPGVERDLDDLGRVDSLVHNYGPEAIRSRYRSEGSFHRDWNIERLKQQRTEETTIQIAGTAVNVELSRWDEPQSVTLAHLTVGDHPLVAGSIDLSPEQLLRAIETLVVLQDDPDALAEHQDSFDEASEELTSGQHPRVR